ncbi:hypothetical protein CBL_04068 [Carabus blaptoides fortunei]
MLTNVYDCLRFFKCRVGEKPHRTRCTTILRVLNICLMPAAEACMYALVGVHLLFFATYVRLYKERECLGEMTMTAVSGAHASRRQLPQGGNDRELLSSFIAVFLDKIKLSDSSECYR